MKIHRWTVTLVFAAGAWHAAGQTVVDLSRQGKLGTGTTLPAQCALGQVFFKTDAPAGTNLYACTTLNGWSVVGLPMLGGDASGTQQSMTVKGLQGRGVSAASPADQSVLRWNATTGQWEPGASGNTILNGSGAPASGTGLNGDFYLRTDTNCLYGPKDSGGWPGACTSVVGPPGSGTTPAWTTVPFSSAPAFTVTSPMQVFQITLTGNVASPTITGTSADGQDVTFKICQDGVGGRTFAPPASFVGFGTLDPTPGVCNLQSFRNDVSGNFVAITKMRTDSGAAQLSENNGLYPLPAAPQAIVGTNDTRLGNARPPTTHAATHQNGGADEVATATPGPNAIPKAGSDGTLAAGWMPPIASGTTIPAPTITGHPTIEGVTSTGASGTGALVFATSPTLVAPNIGAATATTVNKITLTPPATAATLAFGSNNSTWTFPTGGGTLGLGTITSVSGTANQITSTGGATPSLSLSPTLALPGTINKVTLAAPTTAWTIQPLADNQTTIVPGGTLSTATVTGSSLLKGSGGNAVSASAVDVVTLFSTCSGTQYLGADGACHNAGGGSGTVTVVGAGNLTSTAIVTGGGAQAGQTPSPLATVDSSGNVVATSFTSPAGAGAGAIVLGQGAAPSAGTTAITLHAPTSVTSYKVALPGAAATGLLHWSNAAGTVTESVSPVVAADTDTSIAHTGVDINTSYQVTATHLAAALPAAQGGSGVANTATLTLGTSNQNWASLGTGIVKNTTTTGALSNAAAADVIGLFTSCSGTQYLGADGACHTSASGGMGDPGSNGMLKRTALNTTAVSVASDVVGLFSSCSGTQYLGADGACHTSSGAVSSVFGQTGVVGAVGDIGATGLVTQLHDKVTAVNNASSPYTVLAADTYITCDATAGAVTITLPAATGTGREISVKKIDSSTNACTPTRAGSDLIDGATTYSLTTQYAASKIVDQASAVWARSHVNQLAGDVTGISTANTVVKVNGGSVPASAKVLGSNGSSQPVSATASDVASLFSSCSGIQYLGADGACHTASGGGATTLSTQGIGWFIPFGRTAYMAAYGMSINVAYAMQFVCCQGVNLTVRTVVVPIMTSQVSSNVAAAFYADSAGAPGSLLGASGGIASTSTGAKFAVFGSPLALTQGTVYWLALSSDTASVAWGTDGTNTADISAMLNEASHPRIGRCTNAVSWSSGTPTFNATCGSLTSAGSDRMPTVALLP